MDAASLDASNAVSAAAPSGSAVGVPLRRSNRKRKAIAFLQPDDDTDEVDEEEEGEEEANERCAKRLKRIPSRGGLSQLPSMPLDIVCEILAHLLPIDVLHLARTDKHFRGMLMRSSSSAIWKRSLENVPGLPECPEDLCEPQYVALVFDRYCFKCGTPNIRTVEWRLRVKFCQSCADELILPYQPWEIRDVCLPDVLSHRRGKKQGIKVYVSTHVEAMRTKIESLPDSDMRRAFAVARKKVVDGIIAHAERCESWSRRQSAARTNELEGVRKQREKSIHDKLTELGWGDVISKMDYGEKRAFEKLKQVNQAKPLTERVWSNIKIPLIEHMEKVKIDVQKRDRIALVNSRKRVAIGILRKYKNQFLPYRDVLPEPPDFISFPGVAEVLELPSEVDVTEEHFAKVKDMLPDLIKLWRDKIKAELVDTVKRQGKLHEALSPMELYLKAKTEGETVEYLQLVQRCDIQLKLGLATTVFKCKKCFRGRGSWVNLDRLVEPGEADPELPNYKDSEDYRCFSWTECLFYPDVLGHRCCARSDWWGLSRADPSVGLKHGHKGREKWSAENLVVDERAGKIAERIVRVCGQDPEETLADEMDFLDHRLVCLTCTPIEEAETENGKVTGKFVHWRAAIQHHIEAHKRTTVKWGLVTGVIEGRLRGIERLYLQGKLPGTSAGRPEDIKLWLCVHCRDLPEERGPQGSNDIQDHITEVHKIDDPLQNRDFFKDMDVAPNPIASALYPVSVKLKLTPAEPSSKSKDAPADERESPEGEGAKDETAEEEEEAETADG